jgi:hypothetical protein
MADVAIERTEPLVDVVGFRLSWGAITAGFVVATVVQVLLSVLGLAIGFSAWDPRTEGVGGIGIGAAVWFVATAVLSLFAGGLVLGRLAGILKTRDGVLHGIVMWGLSTLLAVWMVANGVGMLVGTTFDTLTRTSAAVVSGAVNATGAVGAAVANRPPGAPAVPERVQAALDTAEARVQEQMSTLPSGDSIRTAAGEVALDTMSGAATVAWVSLGTMLLSLGGAVWGAAITARR